MRKGRIFKFVFLALILICGLLVLFRENIKNFIDNNRVVLVVNDTQIRKNEYKIRYNTLKENAIQFSSRQDILDQVINGKKYRDLLKDELFDVLIEETLCLQEIKRRNITLSSEEKKEVDKYISDIKSNSEMLKYFNEYLKKIGSDENRFRKDLEKTRLINKLYSAVTQKVTVGDSEIKDYYMKNINAYKKVKIYDIFLEVKNGSEEAEKRKLAEKLIKEIKNGADISELAKKYSDDAITKKNGGIIDYFRRGEKEQSYGSVFEEEVFKLSKGELSNIIKTNLGYHIVKVIDVKTIPLEEVKDEIRSIVLKNKKNEVFNLFLKNLKESSKIKVFKEKVSEL
ncbi:peptidylprolyl isomerase [Caldicellulosiruptor morganii]|uniref:Peptidylprolyl isomerase n=1 Tax=Caldicellulosiruptor morganii TaxID=1387555 RepID=A0ABY7BMD3_9FIRM|nr:peptidylprolyl isomerase [Caldicellulosiruptor morganii]WAM33206.1 peptidylprolyl isomerase [Caldicellulosiruptor morganii]